jgi:hypothetical protein
MLRRLLVASATLLAALAALPAASASASAERDQTEATFDGTTITLDDGTWEGADACAVVGSAIQCFASEAEMNAWLAAAGVDAGLSASPQRTSVVRSSLAAASLSCSSSLRLYENAWFGGRTLYFSSRAQWFNLSAFGFANRTSSFRVGACTSYLADYDNGGGAWYPGSGAYVSVGAMSGSWNDRISSVYIV